MMKMAIFTGQSFCHQIIATKFISSLQVIIKSSQIGFGSAFQTDNKFTSPKECSLFVCLYTVRIVKVVTV